MQQSPTLSGVRLRTVGDALKVFHAVAQGALPMIVRRLDFEERKGIKSGNIYVWEERNASTSRTGLGIERWTDGHQYTPSRVRDDFLLYVCKDVDPAVAGQALSSAQIEAHRLIKQTYSVYVEASPQRKKWHITAYYTPATLNRLVTIDHIPILVSIIVPPNVYSPARATKHLKGKSGEADTGAAATAAPSILHSYPHSRRSSLTIAPTYESQASVSRGQSQVSGNSTRSRYSGEALPGMDGTLTSPGAIYPPSSTSAAHSARHIVRPSTAMGPSSRLDASLPALTQEHRLSRLSINPTRRGSISQPYPFVASPGGTSPRPQFPLERRPSTPSQMSIPSSGARPIPISMVPLSLLEQTHNRHGAHRSPIDDSLLKRLPPATN